MRVIVWILALAPIVWLVSFWHFALRARWALGRWPTPYNPDPKDLGFDLHYTALLIGIPGIWAATIALLLVVALNYRSIRAAGARPLLAVATALGSCALLIGLARLDPGQFFYWFGD